MAAAAPNSNDILGQARFSTSAGSSSSQFGGEAPTAAGIFSAAVDPSALHPLAGLVDNKDLDYLLLDDDKISGVDGGKSVLPSRGWGDELCYGTGSTYLAGECSLELVDLACFADPVVALAGLALGGVWGLREGLRKPILPTKGAAVASTSAAVPGAAGAATTAPVASAVGAQATAFAKGAAGAAPAAEGAAAADAVRANAGKVSGRLRWNNILNQVTRRGSFTGNSAGVLGKPSLPPSTPSRGPLTPSARSPDLQRLQLDVRQLPRQARRLRLHDRRGPHRSPVAVHGGRQADDHGLGRDDGGRGGVDWAQGAAAVGWEGLGWCGRGERCNYLARRASSTLLHARARVPVARHPQCVVDQGAACGGRRLESRFSREGQLSCLRTTHAYTVCGSVQLNEGHPPFPMWATKTPAADRPVLTSAALGRPHRLNPLRSLRFSTCFCTLSVWRGSRMTGIGQCEPGLLLDHGTAGRDAWLQLDCTTTPTCLQVPSASKTCRHSEWRRWATGQTSGRDPGLRRCRLDERRAAERSQAVGTHYAYISTPA